MKKQQTNFYQIPECSVFEVICTSVLCESLEGSTVNDLVEDDTTLGGLF